MRRAPALAFLGLAAGLAALAASCTVGPDFVRPRAPTELTQYTSGTEPSQTVAGAGQAQRFETGYAVPERWWALFGTPALDALLEEALDASPTLQLAVANLRQSQDNLRAGFGVVYPQLNAGAAASANRTNPAAFGVEAPPNNFGLFTLSASVSYALDLFGSARRALEGLKAQVDAQRFSVLAAYLSLTGNLVNAAIARASYDAQLDATRALIRLEKEIADVSRAQVKAGTLPYSSLLSLQAQLAATEATLAPLAQRRDQAAHLLATLCGQPTGAFSPPPLRLSELKLPERLPRDLPSDLVRQRPDILQSEAQLHVASAQIGVATAALYPSISLSGSFGGEASSLGNLISSKSEVWNLGGNLTAPLFHGGTLRAQKQAAVDAFEAALANYRQVVLGAFQQVADALRGLEHDAEAVQAQSLALTSAEQALGILRANYRAGTASYVQLLTADEQYLQSKLGYLQAVSQRLQDTVALFAALGGGWWNAEKPVLDRLTAPRAAPSPGASAIPAIGPMPGK